MRKCNKCGAEIDDYVLICPSCGGAPDETKNDDIGKKISEGFEKLNDTKETTSDCDAKDIEENKAFAILSYIGPLFIIGLIAAPNSKFTRFHANQGLVLFILEILFGIATKIFLFIPIVSILVNSVTGLISFLYIVIGVYNSASGRAKELPLIGGISIIK